MKAREEVLTNGVLSFRNYISLHEPYYPILKVAPMRMMGNELVSIITDLNSNITNHRQLLCDWLSDLRNYNTDSLHESITSMDNICLRGQNLAKRIDIDTPVVTPLLTKENMLERWLIAQYGLLHDSFNVVAITEQAFKAKQVDVIPVTWHRMTTYLRKEPISIK